MDDVWLSPRSPLEAISLPSSDRFRLSEAPPFERYVLRGDEIARRKVESAFGLGLPAEPGIATEREGRAALWLGPDEWLLLANDVDADVFPTEIEVALEGAP